MNPNHPTYTLGVEVRRSAYAHGKYLYFRITCDPPYIGESDNTMNNGHPFGHYIVDLPHTQLPLSEIANVVADNAATRAILRLIAIPDSTLQHQRGNSGNAQYRSLLIAALTSLWD